MGCALWTCTFRVWLRTQRNRWQNMKSVPRSSETARSLRRPLYRGSISKSQRKYVDSLLSQDQSMTINHQKHTDCQSHLWMNGCKVKDARVEEFGGAQPNSLSTRAGWSPGPSAEWFSPEFTWAHLSDSHLSSSDKTFQNLEFIFSKFIPKTSNCFGTWPRLKSNIKIAPEFKI